MSDAATTETKGWLGRMTEQFKKSGQTSSDFLRELKALTRKDAMDFHRWLNEAGLPTEPPAGSIAFAPE